MQRMAIVGGGVVGSMHALLAHRAGWDVVHFERDLSARSASVRNFGLVWVSGRAPSELPAALRARELWTDIGAAIPEVGFRPHGSLTVALSAAELEVMDAFAASPLAPPRGVRLLAPDHVVSLNGAVRGKVFGALFGSLDAIVEPMQVPGAIQTWLGSRESYRLVAGRTVASVSSGAVVDHTGARTEADVVVVCPGDVFTGVVDLSRAPLRRVRLQMMQTAPFDRRLTTSIADADSLRYYPAYAEAPLARLGPQAEVAAAHAMQLLVAQRLDGGLTIGDTHAYEEPFDFALDEEPYGHLTRQAERILGSPLPSIVRRWAGVYSQCLDGSLCYRDELEPGVWVVTGLGGRGMTCAPAVAEETLRLAGVG